MNDIPRRQEIGLEQTFYGRGEIQQKIMMSPPIANSMEEVEMHSCASVKRGYREDILGALSEFLAGEDNAIPYTDGQIATYLINQGHENVSRREVALARNHLGVDSSTERRN